MFDAKYIFLPFKQPKICKRFKFAVYKRTLRFFLLFINYFTSDFTLSMCMFLCRGVVILFYWLIGNIYLFISTHHQLPTLFSPLFISLRCKKSILFPVLPSPLILFILEHTHPPQNFLLSKLISDNSRKSGLKLPFLAYYTNLHTKTHKDTQAHRKSNMEEK